MFVPDDLQVSRYHMIVAEVPYQITYFTVPLVSLPSGTLSLRHFKIPDKSSHRIFLSDLFTGLLKFNLEVQHPCVCFFKRIIQTIQEKSCNIYQHIVYLCHEKKDIDLWGYFERFVQTLEEKELEKLEYVLSLLETEDRLPVKFIKHIQDGIFELRVMYSGNIYRVFFIFDKKNIVILFNGFQKKTQRAPKNEIEKALKIKAEYYGKER